MFYFFIFAIIAVSSLLVLVVLLQNPKSGMAANFGVSNQILGVRQTANSLEKATWTFAALIVIFSLGATMTMPKDRIDASNRELNEEIIKKGEENTGIEKGFELPSAGGDNAPATDNTKTE